MPEYEDDPLINDILRVAAAADRGLTREEIVWGVRAVDYHSQWKVSAMLSFLMMGGAVEPPTEEGKGDPGYKLSVLYRLAALGIGDP